MAVKKKTEKLSHFEQFYQVRGIELINHLKDTDMRELLRQTWNCGASLACDMARNAAAESWQTVVEKIHGNTKRAEPESSDFMAAPDRDEAPAIAVQTDLTGADEPLNRPTLAPLLAPSPKAPQNEAESDSEDIFG